MSGLDAPWGIDLSPRLMAAIVSAAAEARTDRQRQMLAQARADAEHRKVDAAVAKAAAAKSEALAAIRDQREAARLAAARERRTVGRPPRRLPPDGGLNEPSGARVHLELHRARKHRATGRAGRHEARTECPAEKPGCISQGMPSASARSSAGKQLEICQYCQRVYRGEVIPFHLCWFCGASPAWHHGRCCRLAPWGPSHREHVEASDTIDNVRA